MPHPFNRDLPTSRSHIFSTPAGVWRDITAMQPDPEPEPTTHEDDCFIDIQEEIRLIPGETTYARFKYRKEGFPPAQHFAIIWYGSEADREADRNELKGNDLPSVSFDPPEPLFDRDSDRIFTGRITFNTPENVRTTALYPRLVLTY